MRVALFLVICASAALILALPSRSGANGCAEWYAKASSLQSDTLVAIASGLYADAVSTARKALRTPEDCFMDRTHNVSDYALKLGMTQLLVASLLWNHEFEGASKEAKTLLSATYGMSYDTPNSHVLAGDYGAAFASYRDLITGGHMPSVDASLAGSGAINLPEILLCIKLGATHKFAAANSCLSKQANPKSQVTLYLYGISNLAVAKRCTAYQSLRQTLSATVLGPMPEYLNWTSISALKLVDSLFLDHQSEPSMKALLKVC